MKKVYILMLSILVVSCAEEHYHSDLCDAIVFNDSYFVKSYVDDILFDLWPVNTYNDPLGHGVNLDVLVAEINKDICADAIVWCYACIETYPPQSELHVIIDDGVYYVEKYLDIATPSDAPMYFVGMHD